MRRLVLGVFAVVLAASGCTNEPESGAAEELLLRAVSADELTYKATYAYEQSGPLAESRRTILTIAHRPPNDLRSIETVTPTSDDETVSVTAWYARQGETRYACWEDSEGVRCREARLSGTFNTFMIDEMLDLVRTPDAFRAVQVENAVTIAGERGRCYVAAPPKPTPVPVRSPQPRFEPESFRLEYCYTDDGILLRARRRITGNVPADLEEEGRLTSTLQATSVSRDVETADLRLPGPVVDADSDD